MELGNMLFGNSRGNFEVPRGKYQNLFYKFFEDLGFDSYGFVMNEKLKRFETQTGGFENDTFIISPYYWGDDEEIMQRPNFVYKPTNLEIRWYKYPLRDSYSNQQIEYEQLKQILNNCKKSIQL